MTRSTYAQPLPAGRAAETAAGHRANGSPVPGRWHLYPEMAAAGLWTTPTDLARFAIEVQRSLAGRSNRVLSQAMTRQMLTVQKGENGLGFALAGRGAARTFGHTGRDAGFDALLLAFAEGDQGLVVMVNANENAGVRSRIAEFVGRKYKWPSRPAEPAARE